MESTVRSMALLPARLVRNIRAHPQQWSVLGALFGIWVAVNYIVPVLLSAAWLAWAKQQVVGPSSGSARDGWRAHAGPALAAAACGAVLVAALRKMQLGGAAATRRRQEQRNAALAERARREMQQRLDAQAVQAAQEREAQAALQRQLRQAEKQAGAAALGSIPKAVPAPATATATAAAAAAPPPPPPAPATAVAPAPLTTRPGSSTALSPQAIEEARQKRVQQLQQQAEEAAARKAEQEAAAKQAAKQAAAALAAERAAAAAQSSNGAGASSSLARGGGSSDSLYGDGGGGGGGGGGGASSRMIPRDVALEAEARQQQWLQQLSAEVDPAARASRALQHERAIRQEQDAEYTASLRRDQEAARRRAEQEEQQARAEEARKAKQRRLIELAAAKEQLRASLPPEPPAAQPGDDPSAAGAEPVVSVRVRMPDGSVTTRRWLAAATVAQLYGWVQGLEACPLWEPEEWRLAVSYPRALLGREEDQGAGRSVGEVAGGDGTLVLMVERV